MARVCVVRQYYFPLDIRVRREVEALVGAGHEVDVVCQRRGDEPRVERLPGITIWRLPLRHDRGGPASYLLRYAGFLALATVVVAALHLRRGFALVQVHSMPDTLVFAGVVPRLLGARLLLDLHEVMPEFFATKFGRPMTHPMVRLVARAEQMSIRCADQVMTCTEQMRQVFIDRGAPPEKVTVVLNSADETVFSPRTRKPVDQPGAEPAVEAERFTLICHGSIEERYGLDLAVEAVAGLRGRIPGLRLAIYGEGAFRPDVERLVDQLGCGDVVTLSEGFVPMAELLEALSAADVGIVAMRQDAFRDLTHCNKMYEYLTLRIPVISSRTRSVAAYFPDDALEYFIAGDADDLARAILDLYEQPQRRKQLVETASTVMTPYRWPRQREVYQGVVGSLVSGAA